MDVFRLGELSGQALAKLSDEELYNIRAVQKAQAEAFRQLSNYGQDLQHRHDNRLKLRCYSVIALGLERLLHTSLEPQASEPL